MLFSSINLFFVANNSLALQKSVFLANDMTQISQSGTVTDVTWVQILGQF